MQSSLSVSAERELLSSVEEDAQREKSIAGAAESGGGIKMAAAFPVAGIAGKVSAFGLGKFRIVGGGQGNAAYPQREEVKEDAGIRFLRKAIHTPPRSGLHAETEAAEAANQLKRQDAQPAAQEGAAAALFKPCEDLLQRQRLPQGNKGIVDGDGSAAAVTHRDLAERQGSAGAVILIEDIADGSHPP